MKKILFLLAFAGALFVGCNKDSFKDPVQQVASQSPATELLTLEKMILEYNFEGIHGRS